MQLINANELEMVSGGEIVTTVTLTATLIFVATYAAEIESFTQGFFDGLSDARNGG